MRSCGTRAQLSLALALGANHSPPPCELTPHASITVPALNASLYAICAQALISRTVSIAVPSYRPGGRTPRGLETCKELFHERPILLSTLSGCRRDVRLDGNVSQPVEGRGKGIHFSTLHFISVCPSIQQVTVGRGSSSSSGSIKSPATSHSLGTFLIKPLLPNSRQIAIEFRTAADLQLMHARARDGLKHVRRALRHDSLHLRCALDEQEPRKAKRVHAERLAGHHERMRLAPPREDI